MCRLLPVYFPLGSPVYFLHILTPLCTLFCACLPPFAPQAVSNVNTVIGPAILGRDPTDQKGIDNFMVQELDGTKNEWGCVLRA